MCDRPFRKLSPSALGLSQLLLWPEAPWVPVSLRFSAGVTIAFFLSSQIRHSCTVSLCRYSVKDFSVFSPSWIKKQRRAGNYKSWRNAFLPFFSCFPWMAEPAHPCLLSDRPYGSYAWWTWGLLGFPQHLPSKCSNIQISCKNFTVKTHILSLPSTFYYTCCSSIRSSFLCILQGVTAVSMLLGEPSLLLKSKGSVSKHWECQHCPL